jgi:hypothetical protein
MRGDDMTLARSNPEWAKREVGARAGIGFVGGVIGIIVGNVLWPWARTTADRHLVDRLIFIVATAIVVTVLLRWWYRGTARADVAAAVISSSLTLWLSEIPFVILRAIVKPVAPGLWTTLFGNPDNTLAYSAINGPCVALALVFAVPLCRTWLSGLLGEPRRWAVRRVR